jgi:hypothetical protein
MPSKGKPARVGVPTWRLVGGEQGWPGAVLEGNRLVSPGHSRWQPDSTGPSGGMRDSTAGLGSDRCRGRALGDVGPSYAMAGPGGG